MTGQLGREVTFMFTDIEGSTRLVQRLGSAYADVLAQHHRVLRQAIAAAGTEVLTEGDSFFVIFDEPRAAIDAAAETQRQLDAIDWPEDISVRVRIGLHRGAVSLHDGEYVGVELNRAARISATASGGQVVVSGTLREAVAGQLPDGTSLRDLGEHRLRDFDEPVHLYQLDIDGLPQAFPPLASMTARFELLPSELSSFIGRDGEVDEVLVVLSETRALTMTGPGGTGKTRLALEVARRTLAEKDAGVAFVPLATVTDPRLVAPTIRGALGLREEPGRSSIDTLIDRLRDEALLLVLDNFEQVADAADIVAKLLQGTRRLQVLVTSRTALHIDGEHEFHVPPMSIPLTVTTHDLEELGDNEAVRLFVDRARRARPGFRLSEGNAAAVAGICVRLEGLPLAIELAAARIKLLTPDALLARLTTRLKVLDGRATTDRRKTLRGTIDWSHDLLGEDERALFRRLGVFSGGATLSAVEALTPQADSSGGLRLDDVLGPMSALVDHSLLRADETRGEPRYLMLETIREYAMERLAAAGEQDALMASHATWFLERVHEMAPRFTMGPDAPDEVESDHANVRAALGWVIDSGDTQGALEAVADLWRFWHLRGHLREGLAVCERVAVMPGADKPTAAAAGARYAHASLLYWQGETDEAAEGYRETLEIARRAGSRSREADAQFALSYAAMINHDWPAAHEAARAADAIYSELGDQLGSANARSADAYASALDGDWESAGTAFEEAIAEVEALGDRFWVMSHRIMLGWTFVRMGRLDDARAMLLLNLDGSVELGDRSMENMAIQGLAMVAAASGDTDRALRLAGAADAIAVELGGKAPDELVIAQDPTEVLRAKGIPEEDIDRLLAEGRRLNRDDARALARKV